MKKEPQEELKTWNLPDRMDREKKLEREWIRYPFILEKLGLQYLLYLEKKTILDIGSGPMGGLLQFIPAREKISLDPLNDQYLELFPQFYNPTIEYKTGCGEKIPLKDNSVDLIISINSLDHCQDPQRVVNEVKRVLGPSGYFAVMFCINLSKVHPHPAHHLSINQELFHQWIDEDFETINEEIIKYGWIKYNNKVGQPALVWLGRLITKG